MFRRNHIRSRVLKTIEQRIQAEEKIYEEGCKKIDNQAEADKRLLEAKCIDNLIGKII